MTTMPRAAVVALLPAVMVPALLLLADGSVWPAIFAYHGFCIVAPVVFRLSGKRAGLAAGDARRWLPLTVALSVLLLGAGEGIRHFTRVDVFLPQDWELVLRRMHPWWAFVGYSLLVNAFCEEYFWRGFVLAKMGIPWSSVLFWLMHAAAGTILTDLGHAALLTLPTLVAGLAWGWMRERYSSLWPSIITHLAADAAILRVASALLAR